MRPSPLPPPTTDLEGDEVVAARELVVGDARGLQPAVAREKGLLRLPRPEGDQVRRGDTVTPSQPWCGAVMTSSHGAAR